MIWNVAYVVGSAAVSGGAAPPGAGSIVSRLRLVGRLGASARVTVVSAPPASGKTVLLRSWISQAGAASCATWVPAGRSEHDPQQFWPSVPAALCKTGPGVVLVPRLTAAPDLDPARAVCPRKAAISNQPRTEADYIPTLLRRARSWSRSAALQSMRIGSKNGHETGDADLRDAW
jgi:hypothetical protein